MKRIVLVCILSIGASLSFAQELEKDSLAVYLQNAQYQKAIEFIDNQEATKELLYQKAICYKSLNDYLKAISLLETLSNENPDDIPVQLQLALCYEAALLYPQSIARYNELIKLDSANVYFQMQKAELLYRYGKYPAALKAFSEITPDYNLPYLKKNIGMCYEKLNQLDSAKVYYNGAWELEPKDSFSALSLVKLHIKQEDFVAALHNSQKFISQDSTNLQMNVLNAFTYYSINDYETAASLFEKCRAEGDSSLIVNRGLGISYFFLKNDSVALPHLSEAFSQDTTNMTVLYALASVYYNLQYFPEAIQCYQKLVEHATPNKNMLHTYIKGLGMAYEKNRLFQEAYSNYMAALQYASSFQTMELYYLIANICDKEINERNLAIYYYEKYKELLHSYKYALSEEKETNTKEIKEIEDKITALDNYIQALKNTIE
jgi:tetratricopeptide (TPR) repeat protein